MNILVIGGTGFIGSHVTSALVEKGHRVAVVHREPSVGASSDVLHIRGARQALSALRPQLTRFQPAVVLDVIPYTERDAHELVKAFIGVAERVVALSSSDVYRNYDGFRRKPTALPDPVPLREDAPLRETLYPYRGSGLPFDWADDYEKILVERVLKAESELSATLLRLPAVYGPGDRQNRVGAYVEKMRRESRIPMTKEQAAWRWTRGYVENVAAAVVRAVGDGRAAGHVYNIGEEVALTELGWATAIAKAVHWTGEFVEVHAEDMPGGRPGSFDYRYELMTDTTRVRHDLDYRDPIDRQEALRRTIEWERSGAR